MRSGTMEVLVRRDGRASLETAARATVTVGTRSNGWASIEMSSALKHLASRVQELLGEARDASCGEAGQIIRAGRMYPQLALA